MKQSFKQFLLVENNNEYPHKDKLHICGNIGFCYEAVITDVPVNITQQQFDELFKISKIPFTAYTKCGKWNDLHPPGNIANRTFADWFNTNPTKFIGTWRQFSEWVTELWNCLYLDNNNDFED